MKAFITVVVLALAAPLSASAHHDHHSYSSAPYSYSLPPMTDADIKQRNFNYEMENNWQNMQREQNRHRF